MCNLVVTNNTKTELTPQEYAAMERFAIGLKDCLVERQNKAETETIKATFDWVISLINLHLQLHELSLERYAENLYKDYIKGGG